MLKTIKLIDVLRDTARAPNPTIHKQSTKWASKAYVPKKAYFGAKMAVFGPKILILFRGSKSSDTHISEKHLGTSFALFFWSGKAPNGSETPYFGPK